MKKVMGSLWCVCIILFGSVGWTTPPVPETERHLTAKQTVNDATENDRFETVDSVLKGLDRRMIRLEHLLQTTDRGMADTQTVVQNIYRDIRMVIGSMNDVNAALEKSFEVLSKQQKALSEQANQIHTTNRGMVDTQTAIHNIYRDIRMFIGSMNDVNKALERAFEALTIQKSIVSDQADHIDGMEHKTGQLTDEMTTAGIIMDKNKISIEALSTDMQKMAVAAGTMGAGLDSVRKAIAGIDTRHADLEKEFSVSQQRTDADFDTLEQTVSRHKKDLSRSIVRGTVFTVLAVAAILCLMGWGYVVVARKTAAGIDAMEKNMASRIGEVDGKIDSGMETAMAEAMKSDAALTQIIEKQMDIAEQQMSQPTAVPEPDHSLAIQAALEIHRMRKRISNMSHDVKGISALNNSLNRLEEKMNAAGYEIVNLLGKPFSDGLSVKANFVPSDELNPGEEIITKIINPQINFNGVLIYAADVEVSTGD
jgi:chromosome segregation ATPase